MPRLTARPSTRRIGTGLVVGGLVVSGSALGLGPGTSGASSHREAPFTAGNPLVDNTDTYAFVSPDSPDTTTLIANWIPFQDPAGGPNFYPWGDEGYRYNIKVDNDGDAVPDITYEWTFTNVDTRGLETFLYADGPVDSFGDANLRFKQTYDLVAIPEEGAEVTLVDDGPVAPSHVGDATFPNYQALRDEAVVDVAGGVVGQSFVGQADDPFFLDLRVFDLLYGADLSEAGSDTLTGYNTNSVALQLPTAALTAGGDDSGVIGVWSTTDQQTFTIANGPDTATPTGDFVQVSRLGSPLVNEVVIPAGLKDAFNNLNPEDDASVQAAVDRVNDPELARLIEAVYGIPAPATPRDDLFAVFLTGIDGLTAPSGANAVPNEVLRLNTGLAPTASPNRLGVLAGDNQGYPNGRRLADDVLDISIQAVEGAVRTGIVAPLAAGDAVDANDKAFGSTFPYLALPTSGSSTQARGTSVGVATTPAAPAPAAPGGATGGTGSGAVPRGGVATGDGGAADGGSPLVLGLVLTGVAMAGAGVVLRSKRA